ncbi:hypothetical protein [Undibacterium sp. Ren11W]|uniref:hypothetical protein n=1 Tax=Undibacterium sp. Ren11W TaxID=3413045 RepID=UPI003BF010C1
MNKEIAEKINELMLECSGKFNQSITLVMNNCSDIEFNKYRDAMSEIMTVMLLDVMNPIYEQHPDLKPSELI